MRSTSPTARGSPAAANTRRAASRATSPPHPGVGANIGHRVGEIGDDVVAPADAGQVADAEQLADGDRERGGIVRREMGTRRGRGRSARAVTASASASPRSAAGSSSRLAVDVSSRQPLTTCAAFGNPAGRRAARDGSWAIATRTVAAMPDGEHERRGRELDALDRDGRDRTIGEDTIAARERDRDRQRRVVLDLDDGQAAGIGDGVHPLDGVAGRYPDPCLDDGRTGQSLLAHRRLARRDVPAIVGGHEPVERR